MNYFLTFPTDVQGYMDDSSISEEYQQLFSEIDYVKDHVCMRHSEPTDEVSSFDETKAGYDGTWTKVEDLFELYLPAATLQNAERFRQSDRSLCFLLQRSPCQSVSHLSGQ